MKQHLFLIQISIALIMLVLACKPNQKSSSHLGHISFDITGSDSARFYFQEGLLLLHSFEFADARREFEKAQAVDSHCLMAIWGEAMSYNHPLWRQQKYDQGNASIEAGKVLLENTGLNYFMDKEMDFWNSVVILYQGEGNKFDRDADYAKYMGKLVEKYKDDHEVAAFYALALLGSVSVGRDDEIFEKSASIARSIIKENPAHPGALHYLIHAYDDPFHAGMAVEAAHSYAKVAPDAAHALHMPSHIYVALGMWDHVIRSNIDSYEASVRRMEREGLDHSARSYHAFHWLLYGYLQKRNKMEADQIMREMHHYTTEVPSKGARDYLIAMVGNYMIETKDYGSELITLDIKDDDLNIVSRSAQKFIKGWRVAHNNLTDSLSTIIQDLKEEIEKASYRVTDAGTPMCRQGQNPLNPNRLDITQSEILLLQLKAKKAMMENNLILTDSILNLAVKLEQEASYSYGPPVIMLPTFEMYGNFLLEQGRYKEAIDQFEHALERGPRRTLSLEGCEKAYRLAGYELKAQSMASSLQANLESHNSKQL